MPRPKKRSKHRLAGIDEYVEAHLREGWCLKCSMHLEDHSGDALREVWEAVRHIILPAYIREYPGSRPWGWWEFDRPQGSRRERKDGGVHPHDNKDRTLHVARSDNKCFWERAYRLFGGLPSCHVMPFDAGLKTEMFEDEWEFLQRNGLLLPEDSLH